MITDADAANAQIMFVLMKSEKIKETRLKFSQKRVTFLYKMTSDEETRVKLIERIGFYYLLTEIQLCT